MDWQGMLHTKAFEKTVQVSQSDRVCDVLPKFSLGEPRHEGESRENEERTAQTHIEGQRLGTVPHGSEYCPACACAIQFESTLRCESCDTFYHVRCLFVDGKGTPQPTASTTNLELQQLHPNISCNDNYYGPSSPGTTANQTWRG